MPMTLMIAGRTCANTQSVSVTGDMKKTCVSLDDEILLQRSLKEKRITKTGFADDVGTTVLYCYYCMTGY
jgi:hypothetical protein